MRKRWALTVIISFISIMTIIGSLMYIFDPYFHYHEPFQGVAYSLGNYVYQNDGISKNFEYDAVVTGTSMTEHFSTEEINQLFEVNSVRLTFLGEGFRRINDNLITAFECNDNIKLVIRGVDPIWFVCDEDFLTYGSYDNYPTYLYDKILLNDFKYLYNFDIIRNDLIPEIKRTIAGKSHDVFDCFDQNEIGGAEKVKMKYIRPEKEVLEVTPEQTDEMMCNLQKNIEENVLSTIEDNPDTRFIIFFPPYGIFYWDSLMQNGVAVVERRYMFEQYVIEQLLQYDNVELYSFLDCFEITCE